MSLVTRQVSDIGINYPVGINPSEHQFAEIYQEQENDSSSELNYSIDDDKYASDTDTDRYSINIDSEQDQDEVDDDENDYEEPEEVSNKVITFKRLVSQPKIVYASILQEEDDFLPE